MNIPAKLHPQREILSALAASGNWMFRMDADGTSHNNFVWRGTGEWTVCDKWSTKPTCDSGGLFGQSPRGWGYAHFGTRPVFCETDSIQVPVGSDKIKTPRAKILFTGGEALQALVTVCPQFGGSLDLSGCNLEGIVLPTRVGGSLDLRGRNLEGIVLPTRVGGSLYLRDCNLKGIVLPTRIGSSLDLSGCNLKGIVLPTRVGGSLYLRDCNLEGIVLPTRVGGSLYLRGCNLEGIVLPTRIGGSLDLRDCNLKGIVLPTRYKSKLIL